MIPVLIAITLTTASFGVVGCKSACCKMETKAGGNESKEHALQYYCPMHVEIVRTEPGKCPICGMDLVEKQ